MWWCPLRQPEADSVLYTWAGPEIAVATTKAYSAQLAALYLVAIRRPGPGHLTEEEGKEYCRKINELPELITEALRAGPRSRSGLCTATGRASFSSAVGVDYAAAQEAS